MDPATVDLHADAGESFGPWAMGDDEALAGIVTSMNLACGFHAGDPGHMTRGVELARRHGVALGAHPGFADRQGFGRRERHDWTADEITADVRYQVGALRGIAEPAGVEVRYVKLHGALDNQASRDPRLAEVCATAVAGLGGGLRLYAQSGSALAAAGAEAGLTVVPTVFADRAYRADGTLAPRSVDGAVLHDPDEVAERTRRLVRTGTVDTIDGDRLSLEIGSICLHGDTPGAVALARRVRDGLEADGVAVAAP